MYDCFLGEGSFIAVLRTLPFLLVGNSLPKSGILLVKNGKGFFFRHFQIGCKAELLSGPWLFEICSPLVISRQFLNGVLKYLFRILYHTSSKPSTWFPNKYDVYNSLFSIHVKIQTVVAGLPSLWRWAWKWVELYLLPLCAFIACTGQYYLWQMLVICLSHLHLLNFITVSTLLA